MTGMTLWNTEHLRTLIMTDRISKTTNKVMTNRVNGSITIDVPGNPFYVIIPVTSTGNFGHRPVVTITNTTLSWVYAYNTSRPGSFAANCEIHYGFY